uniref:Uncharacterized protein n=1 Tax=Anguilla anguilla TaxID=7936 RepID=A0A0E9R3V2_ANGAN
MFFVVLSGVTHFGGQLKCNIEKCEFQRCDESRLLVVAMKMYCLLASAHSSSQFPFLSGIILDIYVT